MPTYYEWRSRSGCYFCFFQRKSEWADLRERHPDLFEKAKAYEKFDEATGDRYTWQAKESLAELERPERLVGNRGPQACNGQGLFEPSVHPWRRR